ncbi:hypothetical protein CWE08_10860 [Aliidiomarina iranensis]|uniref:Insecticide toxin TcdB middle/N-terminal domain-containing protein n=1 Tax=Aliidiomarina iranensis TaxID=1434071 RepID=A0A432VRC1_9GAMM|nr:VCBS repeat-containing protein [Aliidiomarina iranensis]RUO18723.1 hypothetical protein CWE08_10860 [Aliidiomarina iranensis]
MRTFNVLFLLASTFLFSGTATAQDISIGISVPNAVTAAHNDNVIDVAWETSPSNSAWPIVYDVQLQLNGVLQPSVRVYGSSPSDPSDPQPMSMSTSALSSYAHDIVDTGTHSFRVRTCELFVYTNSSENLSNSSSLTESCTFWSKFTPIITITELPAPTLPPSSVSTAPSPQAASIVNDLSAVGATSGSFRVDESGAATYSLNVPLPAGIAGNTPEVSVNYHSQGSSGLMGKGWSVGAGSSVERCRQTPIHDARFRAVNLSATDRFCLDGQRLMVISGQYGAPGSVYTTEIEGQLQITALGGSLGNPSYFEVRSVDGAIRRYGVHTDSQYRAADETTVISWGLSEVTDQLEVAANTIRYYYDYDSQTNEQWLSEIRYSQHSVHFDVINTFRFDQKPFYMFDKKVTPRRLLTGIRVDNHEQTQIYTMDFDYDDSPLSSVKRIIQITECGLSGVCLRPLVLEWNEAEQETLGFSSTPSRSVHVTKQDYIMYNAAVDVTGNGRLDFVTVSRLGHWFYVRMRENDGQSLGSEQLLFQYMLTTENGEHPFDFRITDLDGDGVAEILYFGRNGLQNQWRAYSHATQTHRIISSEQYIALHDFSGNGLPDILQSGLAYRDNSLGQFANPQSVNVSATPLNCDAGSECTFFKKLLSNSISYDINGDGLNDLILRMNNNGFDQCPAPPGVQPQSSPHGAMLASTQSNFCNELGNNFWGVFESRRTSTGAMSLSFAGAFAIINADY